MRTRTLIAVLAVATFVVACGGSDFRNEPSATEEVPASASESIDGFIAYLKKLVVSSADMLEPVDTSNVTGPKDETSEPQTVD